MKSLFLLRLLAAASLSLSAAAASAQLCQGCLQTPVMHPRYPVYPPAVVVIQGAAHAPLLANGQWVAPCTGAQCAPPHPYYAVARDSCDYPVSYRADTSGQIGRVGYVYAQ